MLRLFELHPLGSRLREDLVQYVGVDHRHYLRLRPFRHPTNREHARESSLLAPKVRVQPLMEIYTAEVRFTRKIILLQKIHSLKSRDLSSSLYRRHEGSFKLRPANTTL